MTIDEGNELIAEFMGWQKGRYPNLPNKLHRIDYGKEFGISISDLKYHSSWNWLMDVVAKVETNGKLVRIEGYSCEITSASNEHPLSNQFRVYQHTSSKKDATWLAVIDFIEWYNQTKLNSIT